MFTKYTKTWVQAIALIAGGLTAAMAGDNFISLEEWLNVGSMTASVALVLFMPNHPSYPYAKTIAAVIMAVCTILATFLIGGVSFGEWVQVVLTGVAAIGTCVLPNNGDLLAQSGWPDAPATERQQRGEPPL